MSVHSSYYEPRIYPINNDNTAAEIDRLQELSGTTTLNREKINEIGRDGTVGWKVGIPETSLTARQLEYGSIEFWNRICNKSDSNTSIAQTDFDTSLFNIAGYKTDNGGSFLGTIWYPKLRTSGFSLNIGDPEASIERSFTFVGEDEIAWTDSNKYVIHIKDSLASGSGHTIVIGSGAYTNYPAPVADPSQSGSAYFIQAYRLRAGVNTELTEGTDFTYNTSTTTITIAGSASGDVYKFFYTAASYITSGDPFVENNSDSVSIEAESATILLQSSNTLSRIQSVAVDVSFDRQDLKEIGNSEVVSRGIRERTVRITLGRLLETYTLEQLFGGHASGYGKYDVRDYLSNLSLIIKVYSNKNKTTFKMGYKFTNLAVTSQDTGVPTKDFVSKGSVLEGEELLITDQEGSL